MKHLYIIVEGETELEFVNRLLIPHLITKGLHTHIQGLIITYRGGGHGFNNSEHFIKTIRPLLFYENEPVITTMIDHYGINSERKLPNYTYCTKEISIKKRITCMEQSLMDLVQSIKEYPFFIPNILRHEIETLLFANPEMGFKFENEEIRKEVIAICTEFPNIEEINCTPEGAPSKRLIQIYQKHNRKYNKIAVGVDIAELTGIDIMLQKCPRFKSWIDRIIKIVKSGR
jgi:ribosome-associated toxin RatA of RatAB toxin-antitoxin module